MKEIKILGSGCPKCQRLEALTREVAAELGIEARFEHVREMARIMEYPVIGTPALVIDGRVRASGRLPGRDEIAALLRSDGGD